MTAGCRQRKPLWTQFMDQTARTRQEVHRIPSAALFGTRKQEL